MRWFAILLAPGVLLAGWGTSRAASPKKRDLSAKVGTLKVGGRARSR